MFNENLREIKQKTEGCLGVLIMGMDGIAVEELWDGAGKDANLDVAVAEYTALIRNARRTSQDMGLGALRELVVITESANFVMRLVSSDYFLVLAVDPEGNLGRGRYELRRAELILEREFVL
jgi:predicted regulator of Ras-like GTPase activity (Roadblock/LC7/MglB family)